jgi:hypothetical protein
METPPGLKALLRWCWEKILREGSRRAGSFFVILLSILRTSGYGSFSDQGRDFQGY